MPTLTVTATTDYSVLVLVNINEIEFIAGAAATATFANIQFNNTDIRDTVLWTGESAVSSVVINGGSVDASGWTFASWGFSTDIFTFNGTAGVDTIEGSGAKDVINGNANNDIIINGQGNGIAPGDTLNGGGGNDQFQYREMTSAIFDTIDGGSGVNDRIVLLDEGDYFFASGSISNVERLVFGAFTQNAEFGQGQIGAVGGIASVTGTAAINRLEVNIESAAALDLSTLAFTGWDAAVDTVAIDGSTGADTIIGSSQADIIAGMAGADTLSGNGGDDVFFYASTFDESGGETIDGGAGSGDAIELASSTTYDFTSASISNVERLNLSAPNSLAFFSGAQIGAGAISTLSGGPNSSLVVSGAAVDLSGVFLENWFITNSVLISGTAGADILIGSDILHDSFSGNGGADAMSGNNGDDDFTFNLAGPFQALTVDGGEGEDRITLAINSSGLQDLSSSSISNVEIIEFYAGDKTIVLGGGQIGGASGFSSVYGDSNLGSNLHTLNVSGAAIDLSAVVFSFWTAGADIVDLDGTAGADIIAGSQQNDTIEGFAGNDTLTGGLGADAMAGGANNDVYDVDAAGDAVTELLNEGYDTVNTLLASYTLGANVERVNYTRGGNFVGIGNDLANRFAGNIGNDRFVDILGGADIVSGGAGSDSMDFRTSATGAVIDFATNVHGGAAAGDTYASIEKVFGSTAAADTMTAGAGRADFSGFGGSDILSGGANIDKLSGGDGDDTLSAGGAQDTVQGGKNDDTMTGGADSDMFVYVETAASGGFGADTITDFEDGIDLLKVNIPVADSVADFTIAGNGTASVTLTLAAAPANTITLNGAAAITIDAADFLFY